MLYYLGVNDKKESLYMFGTDAIILLNIFDPNWLNPWMQNSQYRGPTVLSYMHGLFTKIDQMLIQKVSPNKFQKDLLPGLEM